MKEDREAEIERGDRESERERDWRALRAGASVVAGAWLKMHGPFSH